MTSAPQLTDLLRLAHDGDAAALRSVFDATYEDLRRMAHARLRANSRGTLLDTTALVHESYLRFANAGALKIEDRLHFFRYASHVMRSVIVDMARSRSADRRGGDAHHLTLNTAIGDRTADDSASDEILRVHAALEDLTALDARMSQVVEMRYFAGMTEAEIGTVLGVTERTVRRDWEKARLLLARALAPD